MQTAIKFLNRNWEVAADLYLPDNFDKEKNIRQLSVFTREAA